jgi:basic membrane lipoprotein Med (substrate-binding protein (PBP1-ABC) superfamily)
MSRKALFLLVVVALMVTPFIGISAQEPLIESACLVTDIGKINDGTFNQFAYEGMVAAAEDFGLDTTFIETQAQTDYETNINTCINEGYDVIVTVGFLIGDATLAAAQANPDVYFIGVDQFFADTTPNLVGIQFREDQAGFLVGVMAGLMTESNTVAGVYGIDVPAVVKYRNGYEAGVAYANPDASTLGVYIDSFTAPDRGAAAAEQFIGEGADVIFGAGGPTGSGAITFAAQNGVKVIGVDQDEFFTTFGGGETPGAEMLITSALKRVDNGVYQMLEALVNGGEGWPTDSSIFVLEIANDGISFAPANAADVPAEVTAAVEAALEGLRDGSIETGVDPVTGALLDM